MIIDSPIISGSYSASGSLNQVGNITVTGSLTVTGNITGNITGSATNAVSASFAATATSASYAANATSASYAAAATSASYALSSTSASYSADATSASFAQSAISASNALTASYLSNYIPPFPFTGSAGISGSLVVNGDITSTGTLTAQTLIVQTITSSVDFVTGSTHFGSIIDNTHQFTGSVTISGSLAVNGSSAILTNQTGAMSVATASYVANAQTASYVQTAQTASFVQNAQTASYVLNAISASFAVSSSYALTATSASNALTASYLSGYVSPFPFTGSAIISGSLTVTGSLNVTGSGTMFALNADVLEVTGSVIATSGFTGSLFGTASYWSGSIVNAATASYWSGSITNAATASFAQTASFVTLAQTASFVQTAQTASFVQTAQTASFVQTAQTASFVQTAQTASFVQTAQTASYVLNAVSSSFATSASNALTASYLSGYVSPFPFTGSAIISGSLTVTGSVAVSNLNGSGVRYLVADESGSITAQSASAALKSTQAFTSTAGQTTFSVTNGYSTGYVDVFINGSKLATAEFTDTSGTNIVLATGSFVNDIVEVVKYTPAAGVTNNVLRQLTTFTASAGQTVFSASYTPGLLDIFYNGSRLSPSDFTANNGTFFTLATGSAAGDILDVLVYSYQVGAFSGIGGVGTASQVAYFGTTNSITGSPNFTISGSTMTVTGSLIVSGSGTFTNIGPAVFSGSITSTAGFTGSFSGTATSASYAANADLLDGLDSTVFTLTSSFAAQTASFTAFTSSILSYTASQNITNGTFTLTSSFAAQTASFTAFTSSILSYTSSLNAKTSSFATTGSNTFEGIQTINSNLTVTGSITAQTLVVQTVTSSVVYSSGSNVFGNNISNTQTFTGSVNVTGSGTFTNYLLSGPTTVLQTAGVASNFVNNAYYNGTDWRFLSTGYASAVSEDTSDGSIGFYTSPSGSSGTTASFTRKAIITNSGSLGLGNSSPSSTLNPSSFPVLAIKSTTSAAFPSYVLQYINGQEAGITLASSLYIDVAGDSTSTNNNIIFRTTSTNSTSTPLVERVRISAAGNVGIGTNAPDRLLALQGSGESWIRSTTTATSTQSWLFGQDGSRKGFEVYDATVSATRFFISPSSGNVGIGTTSPTASLHINANTGLLTKEILIVQGGGSPSGNYGFSVQANNGDKIFYTDNLTYHVYAGLAGGKFFVNTTTSLTNNRMHVGLGSTESFKAGSWETYTYAINNAFIMENAYFDNSFKYRISGYANAFYSDGASGAEVRVAGYGGTGDTIAWKNAATFAPNGSVYNYSNTTAWQQTSDIKIKENVNTLSNSLTTLLNLRPVTFDYKEEFSNSVNWENNDRLNNVGFIAQEFEEVFPEYVGSSERRINGEFETLKNIDTSHLVPYLVKAIQEQQTLITALQEKLERNNII